MQLSRLADRLAESAPPGQMEFGQAWIAAFGGASSDELLRRGAGVRGPVYERFFAEWRAVDPEVTAPDFIAKRWADITAACEAQPRCPNCGTTTGMHASYCTSDGTG